MGRDVLRRPRGHDRPAAVAPLGAEIHDPVGGLDHIEVVLDDQDRVAGLHEPLQDLQELADVLEVQPRRGLVQDVERVAGRPLVQLARELDALRLAAGQRGRRLPQLHVPEPDVREGPEVPLEDGDLREESERLLHAHGEDVGDRAPLVLHLEGLPVVAAALAHLARHVDVRQEVHLDLDLAVARAVLAASTPDVEREPARLEPADAGLRHLRVELADVVEHPRVRGGVRARRPADGRLVDVDDLVDLLPADHPLVPAREHSRAVDLLHERAEQDVLHERGLPAPGDARDADEEAERQVEGHVAEVVLADALQPQAAVPRAAARRQARGSRGGPTGTRR